MGTFVVYEAATYDPRDAAKIQESRENGMRRLGRKLMEKLESDKFTPPGAIRRAFRSTLRARDVDGNPKYLVRYLTDVKQEGGPPIHSEWDVSIFSSAENDDDKIDLLTFKLTSVDDPNKVGSVKLQINKDKLGSGDNNFIMNVNVPRNSSIENDFAYLDNVVEDIQKSPDLEAQRRYLLAVSTFSRCR